MLLIIVGIVAPFEVCVGAGEGGSSWWGSRIVLVDAHGISTGGEIPKPLHGSLFYIQVGTPEKNIKSPRLFDLGKKI
jgi:hypothetical protein